ncbi:MAG: PKD domain-containing protein, partial [Bacteroidota bacterium]
MLRSLSILALVMSLADPAHAQGEPPKVDLTVPMSVQAVYREYVVLPFYNCGTAIYATWPDILGDGDPSDYTLLAAPGQTFKPGLSSFTSPTPNFEIEVPDGFFLHNSGLGGGSQASGMFSPNCHVQAGRVADIAASLDWYAAYKLPDGTPVAFFEWEQGAGRSIRFDAAFDKSFEADEDAPENKQPVAAYAWDFGTEDGDTGSGPMPTFTYPEPGAYTVTLRVTDDDGDVDEFTTVVEVQSGLLVYTEVAPQVASPKDTVEVTIWLKNESQEEIQNVRVGSYAVRFEDEYPDGLDPARLTPQDTPVQTEPPAPFVIPVLVPGAEDVVTLSYAVGSEALYSDPDDGEIPIETTWTSHAADVSGTMASGGAAEVRQRWDTEPCGADPCPNVFVVEPSTFTVGITSASGPRVWTGLQPSLDIDEVRFVRYETIADGTLPVCESGCADFILSVRDEDGVAADGVEVNVTIEQDDGVPIDTAPGGFVCERVVLGKAGTCVNAGHTDSRGRCQDRACRRYPPGEPHEPCQTPRVFPVRTKTLRQRRLQHLQ